MKLFYVLAGILVLLSGVAAAVILQPIRTEPPSNVTVIQAKKSMNRAGAHLLVKNRSTETARFISPSS